MEALDAYELKVNPGKVKNAEEDKAEEDKEEDQNAQEDKDDEEEEDEGEGAFLIPAHVPADNEDSIDEEEEEEEDEDHKEEQQQDKTLAELVIDVPTENITSQNVYDPADPKNSY